MTSLSGQKVAQETHSTKHSQEEDSELAPSEQPQIQALGFQSPYWGDSHIFSVIGQYCWKSSAFLKSFGLVSQCFQPRQMTE